MLRRSLLVLAFCLAFASVQAEEIKPIKVLLIAGGGFHDYKLQKDILKTGIEARAVATVEVLYCADGGTKPKFSFYGNPDYAKGFDVVIHDECSADISDPKIVEAVLKPHKDGIPGVNLHCGMHCYRIGKPADPVKTPGEPHGYWFEYLGLQSSGHGAQKPIDITFTDKEHPITKTLTDWVTINEELYNNIKVFDTAHALASGKQLDGKPVVVAWTNEYGEKKTRVFSTTIGHNNATIADDRYLDLVTRGMLWSVDKLNDTYLKPKPTTKTETK